MTDTCSGTRRYLALWFPFLSTDRLRIQEPDRCALSPTAPPEAPLVLVAKTGNALRLAAADAHAQRLGLMPGLTLADARACQPDLVAFAMDEAADRRLLDRLVHQCRDYSPAVELVIPDGIVIDITGAAHLFGGEEGLAGAVSERLAGAGLTVRYAMAATTEAARALARYTRLPVGDEQAAIHALPVAALGLDPEATLGLQRAGLKSVRDVAARPSAGIAARFGEGAVWALRRLLGEAHVPLAPLPHDAPLRFEHRFTEPVTQEAAIARTLLDLIRAAASVLGERALGGRRFRLTLSRSDGDHRQLVVETGAPTRDPALVMRLFDERIAALADPLDPGFGYDSLSLAIPATEPLPFAQPRLDGDASVDEALDELIDRLSTRLGPGAVRRLVPQDSHIPEQAQLALPAIACGAPVHWPSPSEGEPPMRPLFLFDPPQLVEVIAEVPDGPPHRFRWQRKLHEVQLYEGPERIASDWWRRKGGEEPGKGGLTRDYYRIEDVRGRRYWIFRHGLYDEKPDPRWYLHGLFA